MDYEGLLKNSWDFQKDNIVTYAVATIIAFIGMIFIVTIAPLIYGLAYMGLKGARNEPVEIEDVFEGFRNGNFIRSWIYWLIPLAIILGILIVGTILIGIFGYISSLLAVLMGLLLNLVIMVVSLAIGIIFLVALPLLVAKDYSSIDTVKEGVELLKANPGESIVIYIIILVLYILGAIPFVFLLTTPLALIFLSRAILELAEGTAEG